MFVFVVAKNRTLSGFFSPVVTFSELLNLTVICEVGGFGVDNGTLELISVAEISGWLSNFDIDIKVWFQKASFCPSALDLTVEI